MLKAEMLGHIYQFYLLKGSKCDLLCCAGKRLCWFCTPLQNGGQTLRANLRF